MTEKTILGRIVKGASISGNVFRSTLNSAENYEELANLPRINGETVIGNKTSGDYHILSVDDCDNITNVELSFMFGNIYNRL